MNYSYELRLLKRSAKESAEWRGHKLTRFSSHGDHKAIASCIHCDMAVMVNARPLPNEIDIAGEAVALNCGREDAE